MATTTNYGWVTPDDTSLVKDGASAIRTLGSSIDTSVKSLNPGTTSGDLDYYTSSTAKSRLAIGTTGQVLTVSGGAPSWATPSSGGMTLISTTTLSGSTITLSSIPQTYNDLVINIRNYRPVTDGETMRGRFNGDTTASRHNTISTFGGSAATGFTQDYFRIASGSADNTATTSHYRIHIPDYTNTSAWKYAFIYGLNPDSTTATNFNAALFMPVYNQSSAITSLEIYNSSGNFNAGTVLLYGVK